MEPGKYYLHDTYVEILRPIKATPIIKYDSVGNLIDLDQTEDGTHPYLISSSYSDSTAASYIKNHPDCYHLELKTGQKTHLLYYDTAASLSADPLPIAVPCDKNDPSKVAYVDWVALGDIDNNGVLAEKLIFSKDEAFAYMVKFIKAKDEIALEEAINEEYQEGDLFRFVGIERPVSEFEEE